MICIPFKNAVMHHMLCWIITRCVLLSLACLSTGVALEFTSPSSLSFTRPTEIQACFQSSQETRLWTGKNRVETPHRCTVRKRPKGRGRKYRIRTTCRYRHHGGSKPAKLTVEIKRSGLRSREPYRGWGGLDCIRHLSREAPKLTRKQNRGMGWFS